MNVIGDKTFENDYNLFKFCGNEMVIWIYFIFVKTKMTLVHIAK